MWKNIMTLNDTTDAAPSFSHHAGGKRIFV